MALDKDLITMLVCPKCKEQLTICPSEDGLLCEKCQVVYPVLDDIPVMLTEESVSIDTWTGSI